MLHRTLLASPPLATAVFINAAASSMQSLGYACCPPVVVEKEQKAMEVLAMKMSLRPEQQQQQSHGIFGDEGNGWGLGEKGSVLGEGFSVDELLDLGDFGDNDKDEDLVRVEEAIDDVKVEPLKTEEMTGDLNSLSPPSSSSSAVSFEATPIDEISLPAHDVEDLEWVSYIIDDTLADFPSSSGVAPQPLQKASTLATKPTKLARENSDAQATPQGDAFIVAAPSVEVPVRAKRSKRARATADATAWSKSGRVHLADSTTSSSSASSSASSCLIYDHAGAGAGAGDHSVLLYDTAAAAAMKQKPKKRGRKPKDKTSQPPATSGVSGGAGERRCSHCGVSKTPQWRAGPMGAKTLCNACGVRFKSGRLLPEYRPACSPTFESSIHSNSHRKVLEMRRKKEVELPPATLPAFRSS